MFVCVICVKVRFFLFANNALKQKMTVKNDHLHRRIPDPCVVQQRCAFDNRLRNSRMMMLVAVLVRLSDGPGRGLKCFGQVQVRVLCLAFP